MHGLGICYKIGQGCEKNDTKAFEWHEKSAQLGDSHAMYWCGVSYKDGTGVTKDVHKAKEWLTKGVAQNNADSQEVLDELNGRWGKRGMCWGKQGRRGGLVKNKRELIKNKS